jgi:hypothetical protein
MKSKKNGFLAQIALTGLGLGLLFYAASRTLHFVQNTMPADQQYLGYLFLLATGIGAIIWLYTFLTLAQGAKQRGLSFAMGIIDLLGEGVLVYADTVREAGANRIIQFNATETRTFVIASVGMIFLNAFAWYCFKLFDPKAEQEGAARDLVDDVRDAAFKHLNTPEEKSKMIAELAPGLKAAILDEVTMQVREMAAQHIQTGRQIIDGRAYAADTQQAAPAGIPYPIAQEAKNRRVNADDIALAKSINPMAAPYRACPKCDDTVPLTVSHCAICGTKMPPLPKPAQEGGSQPPAPFQTGD